MYRFILLILFVVCGYSTIFPQIAISGRVFDIRTDEPLPYANIRVLNTSTGSATNGKGEFTLKLPDGNHTFVISYVGYISDTLEIELLPNYTSFSGILVGLYPSPVNLNEVTIFPGENPANIIIRKAIQRRHQRDSLLSSYQYTAYTKAVVKTEDDINIGGNQRSINVGLGVNDSTELKITAMLENHSIGYFRKPNDSKEVILARKQTSNMPSFLNTITGGRVIQNFYTDDVSFFGGKMISPLSEQATDYYFFLMRDTVSMNNQNIFVIALTPDDPDNPGFNGLLYIQDNTFDLVKVSLSLNRAANTGGLLDSILISQQFLPFGEHNLFMPVDYHLFISANVLNLVRFGVELNTIMYEYQINHIIDDDIFSRAIISVNTDADIKDSLYWEGIQSIPITQKELKAYQRIDSLTNRPIDFWDRVSPLSITIPINEHFSFSGPITMYHFNRVEGHSIDFSLFAEDLWHKRGDASLHLNYGFADERFKYDFKGRYRFGDYRTGKVNINIFDRINTQFKPIDDYSKTFMTLNSLFSKYEFHDYYYSKGFSIDVENELFEIFNLKAGFENRTDKSAIKNSDYSFFNRHKEYSKNRQIYDSKVNIVRVGMDIDLRKYIEDGLFRRRVSFNESYFLFGGMISFSDADHLESELDFTTYEAYLKGTIATVANAKLHYRFFAMHNDGAVPFQMLYALPGNVYLGARNYSFRTLEIDEVFGDRIATMNLELDFGTEFFRWLRIPYLKNSEIQVSLFCNAAITKISDKTKEILLHPVKTFPHTFYEAGFGLGHVLFPIELSFAWRLNYRYDNQFRIGFSSFLFF